MKWHKEGLIFEPKGQSPWVVTHAMLPTVHRLQNNIYRIYFSGRDSANRSAISYINIDINEPKRILQFSTSPVLNPGTLGSFDDNGVSPTWIVPNGEQLYLYYFGWNIGSRVLKN